MEQYLRMWGGKTTNTMWYINTNVQIEGWTVIVGTLVPKQKSEHTGVVCQVTDPDVYDNTNIFRTFTNLFSGFCVLSLVSVSAPCSSLLHLTTLTPTSPGHHSSPRQLRTFEMKSRDPPSSDVFSCWPLLLSNRSYSVSSTASVHPSLSNILFR